MTLLSTQVLDDGATSTARLEIDAAEVRIVAGPDRGLVRVLDGQSLRIGSAPECELVLQDRAVSGRHAEIFTTTHGYAIRDLGSKNGIFLQSFRIDRAPLADGMRIDLGQSALVVHSLGRRDSFTLSRAGSFSGLTAHSIKMRALVSQIEQLSASTATVVLQGESGSGKEIVANAIHAASARKSGPFVIFDCGAVSAQLAQSELFGHERGAFTGATAARTGLVEEADGGTLFLDEIAELPPELQTALLGVLERKSFRPVGAKANRNVDVRFIAATHRNLEEEVRAGRFRQDLWYRLSVVKLRVPPLRERPEDIPVLAHQFAKESHTAIPPEILSLLSSHAWPGNVRELRNTISRLAVHGDVSDLIQAESSDAPLPPLQEARARSSDAFERDYLERLLAQSGGSVTRAAQAAGVSRQMLTRLVAKHALQSRPRP